MELNSKIKLRLVQLGIKRQKDIAEQLGVTQQAFSGWVTGRSYPTLETAFLLADILKCKVDDLWEMEK